MPTLEISLNQATYVSLREVARLRSQPLETLVEDALTSFLREPMEPAGAANGGWESDPTGVERRAKIHAEALAWRALAASVRHLYERQFVAVHEGKVIDYDPDRLALYLRVRKRLGKTPVLITQASAPSPREFYIASPRLERIS